MTATDDRRYPPFDNAEIDAAYDAVVSQITIPPCPAWCKVGDGHEYENVDRDRGEDASVTRSHYSDPHAQASVIQFERAMVGRVELIELGITLDPDRPDEEWTADQARALASELVAAAYLLDEITAAQK